MALYKNGLAPINEITSGANPIALIPGAVSSIASQVNELEDFYNQVYEIQNTKEQFVIKQRMIESNAAAYKAEGQAIQSGSTGIAWTNRFAVNCYATKLIMTGEVKRFNRLEGWIQSQTPNLKRAISLKRNLVASAFIESGYTTDLLSFSGEPLFSPEHQLVNGTMANTFKTQRAFSASALNDMIVMMLEAKDMAGNPAMLKPTKLIVSPYLYNQAIIALGSDFMPDSANRGINPSGPLMNTNIKIVINPYLVDQTAWYLLSDYPATEGFTLLWGGDLEGAHQNEPATYTEVTYLQQFFGVACNDYRAIFGSRIPGGLLNI